MKTNHYLSSYIAKLNDTKELVAMGNSIKEQKRLLLELDEVSCVEREFGSFPVTKVDISRFSVKKLIPFIIESRQRTSSYQSARFVELIHPGLDGEVEFKEEFYEISGLGSRTEEAVLLEKEDEFILQYGRWIQSIIKDKLSEIRKSNEYYMAKVEETDVEEQKLARWMKNFDIKHSQVELQYLFDTAFNPFKKIIDPHLAINPSPSFQRDLVWSVDMKQDFIDSILRGLPLGMFYVNDNINDLTLGEGCGRLLWDGKQRFHAIKSFYDGEFPVFYAGKWLHYSEIKKVFGTAMRSTTVGLMTSEYDTLEKIIEGYVMINSKQVKHSDEDLEKAKATLLEKRPNEFKF